MTPDVYLRTAVLPAFSLLPSRMRSPEAQAAVTAFAIQETDLKARRQLEDGPARSHLQFELSGLLGVLTHPASTIYAAALVNELDYADLTPGELLAAMEYDAVLAAGMGRLNLLRDPEPLPGRGDEWLGWSLYLRMWAPGKPRVEKWLGSWARAWTAVDGDEA